jgi:UDP-N-acetylglucosamine--N-acetylmuramyl-(pentapeptide) pyrophosphoryl-undecaprenol N-acetylglucosamine transferase
MWNNWKAQSWSRILRKFSNGIDEGIEMTKVVRDISNHRFIVAGGGTGGHIFPAVAIANALKKKVPDAEFLFIGAKGKMEMEKVPQAGYKIQGLTIAGYNRSSLIKNIGLPFKLLNSFFQVAQVFKSFKPTAVIGVGGYSSFPVLKYAQSKGIPSFIHESNSFAGKSNILLGRKATRVFVATSGMDRFFPSGKLVITGNPVRDVIANSTISRDEALAFFGLSKEKKTILVVGGSLGAKNINHAISKDINMILINDIQLIWQTGKPYLQQALSDGHGKKGVYVSDFIANMESAYRAADVVISRSGAMAVSELCITGKPVVFVPFPFAAEDHQTVNAENLVKQNAALLVKDNEAIDKLLPEVIKLVKDQSLQEALKQNIQKLGVRNADEVIANEILKAITDE